MANIPVIAFAAYSGTGKTTLIEKVVKVLKSKDLRVAVLKHDGHTFEIDREGKDSWRFSHAGADANAHSVCQSGFGPIALCEIGYDPFARKASKRANGNVQMATTPLRERLARPVGRGHVPFRPTME